ncbi:MAG: hypothetical protein A2086_11725 [Spirochaetes bacterium GWD1_27_9]|nr:MAG: hypothetical protein A2Z98_02235 [Spirochaetes bacterium GWB1_27_13]OHD28631.1 MAG: hypothetical protein A2086_11725 [Spirochaetes bacterium GWD1_27_9]
MPNILLLNLLWMGKNLILAFMPLILALILFRKKLWDKPIVIKIMLFVVTAIFYFFLPNAPYVLTDIIHLVRQIKDYRYFNLSDNTIIVFLIPQYLIFFFVGFSFYVIAFQKLLHFLYDYRWNNILIWIIKIVNPFLMSIGILLGRIYRFNSWDIVSNSEAIVRSTLEGFSNFYFFIFMVFNTIIIFLGFEILSLFYKSLFKKLFNFEEE